MLHRLCMNNQLPVVLIPAEQEDKSGESETHLRSALGEDAQELDNEFWGKYAQEDILVLMLMPMLLWLHWRPPSGPPHRWLALHHSLAVLTPEAQPRALAPDARGCCSLHEQIQPPVNAHMTICFRGMSLHFYCH